MRICSSSAEKVDEEVVGGDHLDARGEHGLGAQVLHVPREQHVHVTVDRCRNMDAVVRIGREVVGDLVAV